MVLGLVVLDQTLHGIVRVVLMVLRATELGMRLRDVSFRSMGLLSELLLRTVTFPLVLEKS